MTAKEIITQDLKKSRKVYRNGKMKILFDQPFHLYLDKIQSQAYIQMIMAEKFSSLLHDPALELINRYKEKILKDFKGNLSFYDLGPGLPTKTIPLLGHLKSNGILFDYYPVDISENFLDITENTMLEIGIKSKRIHCLFEELYLYVDRDNNKEKIFFIGLTFNNYRPGTILNLLKKLAGKNGTCIIITEYFRKKNKETIILPYQDRYAEHFNYLSLSLAGIERSKLKYFTKFRNERIEMGFEVLESIILSEELTLAIGTEIITAISYRYSKTGLMKHISRYFSSFEIFQHQTKDISLVAFKLTNT